MISLRSKFEVVRTRIGAWKRRLLGIALAVVAVGAFIFWSMQPAAVPADIAAAARGDLVVTIDDEGETRVQNVYVVSAPLAGRIERITLDVGDEVIANETLLARFQPQDPALLDIRSMSEAEAGVALAEAERARALAELEFARQEFQRAERLAKGGTIAAVTLDRARLMVRTAQAAFNQSVAALAKRRADQETAHAAMATAGRTGSAGTNKIDYVPVYAPINGQVLKRIQESAAILAAGTPLLEIGDPTKLEIVTDLLSTDAVRVKAGNRVVIDDWGGPPLGGVVRRVEPFGFTKVSALGVEEQRVNVVIDFESSPQAWSSLGHGYRVMTRIITHCEQDALKVPVGALFRQGAEWAAFVVDGKVARLRKVEVGERNTIEAQILAGIHEGERVLVHPSDQISDGVAIELRR